MPSPLIATKLYMPQVREGGVCRPRLIEKLQQGLAQKLILISAPAGYGKTTLICEWLAGCSLPFAWVSLDKRDNDPARFWAYVMTALQRAISSAGDDLPDILLQKNPPINEALIANLVNALDTLERPLLLVLDDYHNIETQDIHDGLSLLLEHTPSHFHLVIATRADPPLPVARLRARSQILEIRQADLRFTALEAADFLSHTMRLEIAIEDATRLSARTEGWIAGLQMAAISLQNTEDASGFITSLTGSDHYIFDYLLEEILERQPTGVRRFLLHTSILEQLTGPLCDALLEPGADGSPRQSSAIILEELEHANLFIIPLDHERCWYRYHSLFADLLRGYLQQQYANQIPVLHTRASGWFEKQGLIADAIHHALIAGDWERVAGLISANVFALLEQNELNTVARHLDSVASQKSLARPWLWIGRAWLAAYTGQLSSVESILDKAEAEIRHLSPENSQETLRGHCAAIRAYVAWISGQRGMAVQAAREALEHLSPTDHVIRCQSATVLGLSLEDLDARADALKQALEYARQCSISHVTLFAQGCWAYVLLLQGRLHEAHAVCNESLRLAQAHSHQPFPTLSTIYATMSEILCEWNDLEGALRFGRKAVELARRWEQADALHFAYTNLGEALFASGDVEGAFDIIHEAWQIAQRTSIWFEEITIAQEIEWYLAQDNLEAALHCLRLARVDIEDPSREFVSPAILLTRAQIFFAQKQYTRALDAIAVLLNDLQKRGNIHHTVKGLIWQAKIYDGLGQRAQALDSLKEALTLAAPEDYVHSFRPLAGESFALLHQARRERIMTDCVDRLLEALEGPEKARKPESVPGSRLIEPLSKREMDVLKLLAQGCSDKEIAESLVIARETVHKHLKNIYGKLDAHGRAQAVIRARELGLL